MMVEVEEKNNRNQQNSSYYRLSQSRLPHKEKEYIMCRKVKCKTCGKFTWAGCGQHIEQALAGVPDDQRLVAMQVFSSIVFYV
jgi:hypothetical protein